MLIVILSFVSFWIDHKSVRSTTEQQQKKEEKKERKKERKKEGKERKKGKKKHQGRTRSSQILMYSLVSSIYSGSS
jgi:hypothetical protein